LEDRLPVRKEVSPEKLAPQLDRATDRARNKEGTLIMNGAQAWQQILQINARTAQLQAELWSAVLGPAAAQPTRMVALAVSGMNDVLNSQGYTQASWSNRIPAAAWLLMAAIAVCCNLLLGYGARDAKTVIFLLQVLPLIVSISFFLIADIDSPRGGVILVHPENLLSLVESLRAH
jgi:hypothetical protein